MIRQNVVRLPNVEIDVLKQAQLRAATDFAAKHDCRALVVAPELTTDATIARAMIRHAHKIIAAIDWPKGNQFMADKFRGVPSQSLNCDGFEILLTNRDRGSIAKEIRFLNSFLRDHFPPTTEIRFVFGWFYPGRTEDQFKNMCDALKSIPNPALIRTTHLTKVSSTEGSVESHNELVKMIHAQKRAPVKVSGNVDIRVYSGCKLADRFACTIEQAVELHKQINDEGIKKISRAVTEPEPVEPPVAEPAQ